MGTLFYRFQNTLSIETHSYYVDIRNAHEDFEEYAEEFSTEQALYDDILSKYERTFALRENITPVQLLDLIKQADDNEAEALVYKHKIPYIFGFYKAEIDQYHTLEELIGDEDAPDFWTAESFRYLVVYEGEKVIDEGDLGVIFKPVRIVEWYEKGKN